jgi:hypothetical protein
MYPNLERAITESGLSWRAVAKVIDMAESTFRYKMTEGDFSVGDAFSIKANALPKYDLEFLFAKSA